MPPLSNDCHSRFKYVAVCVRYYVSSSCKAITDHVLFEVITLTVISLNCIILATNDPTTSDQKRWKEVADIIFQAVYTAELLIKIFALGLVFNQGAYLRDPWNVFDLIIVGFGYLQYLDVEDGGFDLKPLRVFRVLRPIRKITSIEGIHTLLSALINSFSLLFYVGVIYFFFLCLFAIAGFQLWHNSLKHRCRNYETGLFDTETLCGDYDCPSGYECAYYGSNPNFGLTHFDHFFASLLVAFTTSTGEGWGKIQKAVIEAHGDYVFLFFEIVVFIEFYFLQNFVLSSLKHNVSLLYEENKKNALLPFVMSNTIAKYRTLGPYRKSLVDGERERRERKGKQKFKAIGKILSWNIKSELNESRELGDWENSDDSFRVTHRSTSLSAYRLILKGQGGVQCAGVGGAGLRRAGAQD